MRDRYSQTQSCRHSRYTIKWNEVPAGARLLEPVLTYALSLYPNPARGSLTIDATSARTFESVDVFNILGQKMKPAANIAAAKITIATNDLPSGIYSIRMLTDKGFVLRKFEVRK